MTNPESTDSVRMVGDNATAASTFFADEEGVQITFLLNGGMSTGAVERFRECVRGFGNSLIREVYRLEETERVQGENTVEITTSMVVKADEVVRSPKGKDAVPVSNFAVMAPVAGAVSALVAGIFGSYLHSWWQWSLCILFALLTLLFLVLGSFELRRRA